MKPSPISILGQSFFAILTGATNSGKSEQVLRLLKAEVDGQSLATPCLYILAEASAEGTVGEVLMDPSRCVVWPCTDCEEASAATRTCFPYSGPLTLGEAKKAMHTTLVERAKKENRPSPPPPTASVEDATMLRAVVVDTASTLYRGSVNTAGRLLKAEAANKAQRAGKKDAPWNNDMNLHAYAARVCGDLIDGLNRVSLHRGLICIVSVHTCPALEASEGGPIAIGETPYLGATKTVAAGLSIPAYSHTWNLLNAKANVTWHCFVTAPNLSAVPLSRINEVAASPTTGVTYGAITAKGVYPGIGQVLWVKRQGGDGPLGVFAELPAYWHPAVPGTAGSAAISPGPDLGATLVKAIILTQEAKRKAETRAKSMPSEPTTTGLGRD